MFVFCFVFHFRIESTRHKFPHVDIILKFRSAVMTE